MTAGDPGPDDAAAPALVWEREQVPMAVRALIFDSADYDRVVLLPAGYKLSDFYFMESSEFNPSWKRTIMQLRDGGRLIVCGDHPEGAGEDTYDPTVPVDADTPNVTARDAVRVWRHGQEPSAWAGLTHLGGDEDWVAYVPERILVTDPLSWLQEGSSFGCFAVEQRAVGDGGVLFIGAHA